jgi:hypothetical protein
LPAGFKRTHRPTVSVLLISSDAVLFVQTRKDPSGQTWILPQGGIEDESVLDAARREVREELGIPNAALDFRGGGILGGYENQPSPERPGKPKFIICVGARVTSHKGIILNRENSDYVPVRTPHALWSLMRGCRQGKVFGTFHAVNAAHRRGLLSWSCQSVMEQLALAA